MLFNFKHTVPVCHYLFEEIRIRKPNLGCKHLTRKESIESTPLNFSETTDVKQTFLAAFSYKTNS